MGLQFVLGLRTRWGSWPSPGDHNHIGIVGAIIAPPKTGTQARLRMHVWITVNAQMTERNQMKKLLNGLVLTVLLASAVAAFTGCRTAHGFGEDMENAGHEIQKGTD